MIANDIIQLLITFAGFALMLSLSRSHDAIKRLLLNNKFIKGKKTVAKLQCRIHHQNHLLD